jgi:hypothetical protein
MYFSKNVRSEATRSKLRFSGTKQSHRAVGLRAPSTREHTATVQLLTESATLTMVLTLVMRCNAERTDSVGN